MNNIEFKIAEFLIERNKTLSVAESCTGGLISSVLTDVSGSSAYTGINFVTYSNFAKQKYLGVSAATLEKYGAVSPQTALEMALGLIKNTGADFSLSTTGIAGPTGGTEEKPVGLIYICSASKNKHKILKKTVNSNLGRTQIKRQFAECALEFLYEFLTGETNHE